MRSREQSEAIQRMPGKVDSARCPLDKWERLCSYVEWPAARWAKLTGATQHLPVCNHFGALACLECTQADRARRALRGALPRPQEAVDERCMYYQCPDPGEEGRSHRAQACEDCVEWRKSCTAEATLLRRMVNAMPNTINEMERGARCAAEGHRDELEYAFFPEISDESGSK